ncbi:ABC transporter permease [Brooklawnia cerclae]
MKDIRSIDSSSHRAEAQPSGRRIPRVLTNRRFVVGGTLVLLVVGAGLLGPVLDDIDPNATDVVARLVAPGSPGHPLGTDSFGRDLGARTFAGIRISVSIGLGVALCATLLGVAAGLVAAYVRPLDAVVMRFIDGLTAFPEILLALAIVAAVGASSWNLVLCMTVVFFPGIARLTRSNVLVAREALYVRALEAVGAGKTWTMTRHILPNAASSIVVQASAAFSSAIVIETALSFLGAGIPAPNASIGNMIADSREYIYTSPWPLIIPASALVLLVLGGNLVGDGLRDILDPRWQPGAHVRGRGGLVDRRAAAVQSPGLVREV